MSRRLRVGMLRIAQETNAFSPFVTEIEAFRHYRRGDDLLQGTSRRGREVPEAMRNAELSGFRRAVDKHGDGRIEIVPLFSAWAIPAGPLSMDAVEHFCRDLTESLKQAGPLDGLFFSLHGALMDEQGGKPEIRWLKLIRELVGDIPIAASADLHAHLTQPLVDLLDIFCAYRTNPHRDHASTGYRAGRLLIRTLFGEIRPTMAWRSLPMVQGGGLTLDFLNPMRPLFRRMTALEKQGEVLDASLLMVHLWLKSPDLGWAVLVITDGDPNKAEHVVEDLAEMAWSTRKLMPPQLPSPEEAIADIRQARWRRRLGTACVCDLSDVVGAGAPGTNTAVIRALLDHGHGLTSYAAIRDAVAIERLWDERIGAPVDIDIGGREPGSSPPLQVRGRLRTRDDDFMYGRVVSLDLDHVKLVVCENAPIVMRPNFYRKRGLRPSQADICVVKNLFPFRWFFGLHNRKTVYVKTHGATDFDRGAHQDFDHPTWPRDDPSDWREADRARRS